MANSFGQVVSDIGAIFGSALGQVVENLGKQLEQVNQSKVASVNTAIDQSLSSAGQTLGTNFASSATKYAIIILLAGAVLWVLLRR